MINLFRTKKICWILFLSYLILLVHFLLFSEEFGRYVRDGYSYNLVPFKEIKRFYKYRRLVGMKAFLINTAGNVACFMPFGFFFSVICEKGKKWYNTVLAAFLFSLTMEVVQLVLKVGSFDVDDMFLNTLGGALGFISISLLRLAGRCFYGRTK